MADRRNRAPPVRICVLTYQNLPMRTAARRPVRSSPGRGITKGSKTIKPSRHPCPYRPYPHPHRKAGISDHDPDDGMEILAHRLYVRATAGTDGIKRDPGGSSALLQVAGIASQREDWRDGLRLILRWIICGCSLYYKLPQVLSNSDVFRSSRETSLIPWIATACQQTRT